MGDNRYVVKFEGKKVCAVGVKFTLKQIDNDMIIKDLELVGGCQGQGKVLSALLNDTLVSEAIVKLDGIICGNKSTSCANEIVIALKGKMEEITGYVV